jgi:carboxylesterase type B
MLISSQSYAYLDDPIVAGYIPQSGTISMGGSALGASNDGLAAWSALSAKLGCGAVASLANASAPLACMRAAPAAAVLDATVARPGASALGSWGPKVDGHIVFADGEERRRTGRFVRRPVLVGNTNNEGATFSKENKAGGPGTLGTFQCPAARAAKARSDVRVPVWRYLYAGEWPNQQLGACCPGVKGAWHGAEIALVFGTTELKGKGKDTDAEAALARKMRDAWAGFAKDPEKGLAKLGWPLYNPNGIDPSALRGIWADYENVEATLVVLGGDNDATIKFGQPSDYDKGCPFA